MNKGVGMEEEKEQDNIIEFKRPHLAVDNTTPPVDWLMTLPIGTIFFTRRREISEEQVFLTVVTNKREKLVEVSQETLDYNKEWRRWVVSETFSKRWELFEVVSYWSSDRTD